MFTGIVTATGKIISITPKAGGVAVDITSETFDFEGVALGDSIAVNGCCLTVTAQKVKTLSFDLSPETLQKTSGFELGKRVNLEKAMRLSDRLDGHLVSGHVDDMGVIVALIPVEITSEEREEKESHERNYQLVIEVPQKLLPFIAPKGSVTVHGVSLTTNTVEKNRVTINLIPHTYTRTVFSEMKVGDLVNLEIDLIARYVARLMKL